MHVQGGPVGLDLSLGLPLALQKAAASNDHSDTMSQLSQLLSATMSNHGDQPLDSLSQRTLGPSSLGNAPASPILLRRITSGNTSHAGGSMVGPASGAVLSAAAGLLAAASSASLANSYAASVRTSLSMSRQAAAGTAGAAPGVDPLMALHVGTAGEGEVRMLSGGDRSSRQLHVQPAGSASSFSGLGTGLSSSNAGLALGPLAQAAQAEAGAAVTGRSSFGTAPSAPSSAQLQQHAHLLLLQQQQLLVAVPEASEQAEEGGSAPSTRNPGTPAGASFAAAAGAGTAAGAAGAGAGSGVDHAAALQLAARRPVMRVASATGEELLASAWRSQTAKVAAIAQVRAGPSMNRLALRIKTGPSETPQAPEALSERPPQSMPADWQAVSSDRFKPGSDGNGNVRRIWRGTSGLGPVVGAASTMGLQNPVQSMAAALGGRGSVTAGGPAVVQTQAPLAPLFMAALALGSPLVSGEHKGMRCKGVLHHCRCAVGRAGPRVAASRAQGSRPEPTPAFMRHFRPTAICRPTVFPCTDIILPHLFCPASCSE